MEDNKIEDKRKKEVINAFNIAKNNSYLRMLFGDTQLFYMFLEGMKYQKSGAAPQNLLDNDDFLKNPEKYKI